MHAVYYISQKRKTIHGTASWLQKFRRDLSIPEFPQKTKIITIFGFALTKPASLQIMYEL
jgi:hypothetical protein